MDNAEIANIPDRYLATEVVLGAQIDGTLEWIDEECAGCGGGHRYSAGSYEDDPRRKLGHRNAPCAKPEPGTPLAVAAEALNLSLGMVVLIDADPDQTVDTLKIVRLMDFAGLIDPVEHEDAIGGGA